MIASTPLPPYYAVIFTSLRTNVNEGYSQMADAMAELTRQQEGYLGYESAYSETGITVSYWQNLDAIKKWKANTKHLAAQKFGKEKWYKHYKIRICLVERDYEFVK